MKDLTIFEPPFKTLVGFIRGYEKRSTTRDEDRILFYTLQNVAEKTNISDALIISQCRKREISEARSIFCKAARMQKVSLRKIGAYVGIKHSTVIHGCHNVDEIPSLRKKYNELFAE